MAYIEHVSRWATLDVYDHHLKPPVIQCVVGDNTSRYIWFDLTDDGTVYTPPEDALVSYYIRRPDKTVTTGTAVRVQDDATGKIFQRIELTDPDLELAGTGTGQLLIHDVDKLQDLRTSFFTLDIGENIDGEGSSTSSAGIALKGDYQTQIDSLAEQLAADEDTLDTKVEGVNVTRIVRLSRSDYEGLASRPSETLYVVEEE